MKVGSLKILGVGLILLAVSVVVCLFSIFCLHSVTVGLTLMVNKVPILIPVFDNGVDSVRELTVLVFVISAIIAWIGILKR